MLVLSYLTQLGERRPRRALAERRDLADEGLVEARARPLEGEPLAQLVCKRRQAGRRADELRQPFDRALDRDRRRRQRADGEPFLYVPGAEQRERLRPAGSFGLLRDLHALPVLLMLASCFLVAAKWEA